MSEIFTIGRVCVKLAGRDAGKKGVVIENIKENKVLVDGEVRRRYCNIKHLYPLDKIVKISSRASHEEVVKALGIEVKKGNKKTPSPKPTKTRKKKEPQSEENKKKHKKEKNK